MKILTLFKYLENTWIGNYENQWVVLWVTSLKSTQGTLVYLLSSEISKTSSSTLTLSRWPCLIFHQEHGANPGKIFSSSHPHIHQPPYISTNNLHSDLLLDSVFSDFLAKTKISTSSEDLVVSHPIKDILRQFSPASFCVINFPSL